ncbi:MAG: hypothetical protein ACD_42C00484G0002 [uncultured bacterium]|nr:MAG: hypothetical protein ACD_42C00484G0002 [uncultured bacterium]OGT33181.1 MAG: hypothetical protein A3C44_06310 [Gammaproteobacteria bacterium RIFCSPHIGHO2_02_FULL_39_13]OGT49237.1 MAG: hypothetical protein A3E53_07225 [Gammaproteobacteria bacterium RIFCSPHIGHO2_12_FULL_39_24]
MNIVYLNGEYLPQEKATISIMDRGFLFGDGVYEVVPVFNGKFFGFDKHMQRMEKSLSAIEISNPHTILEWETIFKTLLKKNNIANGNFSCYCQITRGAEITRSHTFSDTIKPTVVAFITSFKSKSIDELEKGFAAITQDDSRHQNCHIKAINLLPNILLMQKAKRFGAIEAILIRDDEIQECTSSNIFIVKNNELFTPPLTHHILSGVTRDLILAVAKENKIICHEIRITPEMLKNADEVFVTGSVKEVCPITTIDNHPVGNGKTGPVWKKIVTLYEKQKVK